MDLEPDPIPACPAFEHLRAFPTNQVGSVRFLLTPSYAKAATALEAAATSDTVAYEITITNTGLLEVFDISVTAWADGAGISGTLTCYDVDETPQVANGGTGGGPLPVAHEPLEVQGLAGYPDSGLRGGGSLTCTFSTAIGQTEVSSQRKHQQQQVTGTLACTSDQFSVLAEETSRSWPRQTCFEYFVSTNRPPLIQETFRWSGIPHVLANGKLYW